MPSAEELERRALAGRLIRKLRADCIYYGHPEHVVARWDMERLLLERERAVKRLMETAPSARTEDTAW